MTGASRVAVALAVTAVLCGCTGEGPGSPSELVGRRFVSVDIDGRPIPGGGPLDITFPADERLVASAGCNRFAGPADLSGGTIRSGRLSSTRAACPPPRDGADAWLGALFVGSPRWSLDDDQLTLTSATVTVTLAERTPAR